MAVQGTICRDLLRAHVERYRPTHPLLETDWDWFAEFDGRQMGTETLFPAVVERSSGQFVAGGGRDGDCRVVVTKRPDRRPKKPFVEEAVAAFCAPGAF